MKKLYAALTLASVAVAFFLSAGNVQAQGRGNFDPAQFQQRMMERYKEALEVKSDAEWKIIEDRLNKVSEARREVGMAGMGRGMFGGRQRGGDNAQGGDQNRRPPGFEPNPEAEALQKAIDAKASAEEIKAKLAKYRESRKAKEAKLAQTREDLKKVLTSRQEAVLVMMGVLE